MITKKDPSGRGRWFSPFEWCVIHFYKKASYYPAGFFFEISLFKECQSFFLTIGRWELSIFTSNGKHLGASERKYWGL